MMSLAHLIFITLYIVFLLIFMILVASAKKAFIGYSIKERAISVLGLQVSPHYKRFNSLVIAFGAMTGPFALLLSTYLAPSPQTTIATSAILLASVFAIFVGLFPFDIKPIAHHVVAFALFFCALVSTLLLIVPILHTPWVPDYFVVINLTFGLLATIVLYGFTDFHFTKKWIKNIWFYEWIAFTLVFAHNLILSLLLLMHLLASL